MKSKRVDVNGLACKNGNQMSYWYGSGKHFVSMISTPFLLYSVSISVPHLPAVFWPENNVLVRIPPKYSVSEAVGYLKGKVRS